MSEQTTAHQRCRRCGSTPVTDPAHSYCPRCWGIVRDEQRMYPRVGPPPNRGIRRIVRLRQEGHGIQSRPVLESATDPLAYREGDCEADESTPPDDACPIVTELALSGWLVRRVTGHEPYNAIVSLTADRRGTTHGDPNSPAFYLAEVVDLRWW